ncbi:hypothetical protein OJ997_27370 [Solirubrobacter phytolaccae]|uniref:Uncharacterized protein n=1 Tax=Solirubrobacter phytolaccae TaxID=1404360 RepID=A0A9X3NEW4_9ACTN|nr:hypothetical protein [Solirubrobacter phytolaccae]MDA0184059.1 hypothetical protein [Solirubrobacter phytolaccae]
MIRIDAPARGVFPWPATQQSGRLIDAHQLLAAVQQRAGDASLTIHDLDHAMRRLHGHRLNYPLSRVVRSVIRTLLRSDRPRDRRPVYFIDDWTWRRELRRLPRRQGRPR